MIVQIELTELEIRSALADFVADRLGIEFTPEELPIETKSKQNYRSEWETAAIRIKVGVNK
jgi:hypothetical protein